MNMETDDFARRHPAIDRALREQPKAPVMDAAFRHQVMARVAAQKVELARAAASPARVRAQLVLQLLNVGAIALAAVLLIGVAVARLDVSALDLGGLTLGGLDYRAYAPLLDRAGLPLALAAGAAALFYGLRSARLFGWVRGFGL